MEKRFIPLSEITVSGLYPGNYYPVWVDSWGQLAINTAFDLSLTGWLLEGGTAVGPILATYTEADYAADPNRSQFLATKSYVDAQVVAAQTALTGCLPLTGGILEHPIFLTADAVPTATSAVSYGYVQSLVQQFLRVDVPGQVMTGAITCRATSTMDYGDLEAVPRIYVEQRIAATVAAATVQTTGFIELAGSTVTGPLNVYDPTEPNQIATLGYLRKYLAEKTIAYFKSKQEAPAI
jgi:hypothetical protein